MSLPGVIFGRSEALGFSSDTEYLDTSGAGTVRVPHGDFLLSADFGRMGPHLSLSEGDTTVVVRNFLPLVLRLTDDGEWSFGYRWISCG